MVELAIRKLIIYFNINITNIICKYAHEIFCKTINRQTLTLEVETEYSIQDVKKIIEEKMGIPPSK